jgi:hypothetical protein
MTSSAGVQIESAYRHLFVFELEEPNQLEALERSTAHVQGMGASLFAARR